jgi:hypothetical protein
MEPAHVEIPTPNTLFQKYLGSANKLLIAKCLAQQTGMHIGYGSTAYSVGTVYGGKGHLYTPGVRLALLATPYLASLATPRRFTGDHPARPVHDAQLVTPC